MPALIEPHLIEKLNLNQFADEEIAVLTSGGVESAALICLLSTVAKRVHPLYVRCGLSWEQAEETSVRHLLSERNNSNTTAHTTSISANNADDGSDNVADLSYLSLPVGDLYQQHWSLSGNNVPDESTPDSAVYLPGRNVLLLSKASVWCVLNNVSTLAIGHLASNPFADASDEFFSKIEDVLAMALDKPISLIRPFHRLHKLEVLKLSSAHPIHLSFSCIKPVSSKKSPTGFIHCGKCNKCHERKQGFLEAGITDRSFYAD